MTALIDTWSNSAAEEDSMTEEHAWIWREMIGCLAEPDLKDARILDIGCNQGGFLRLLYDTHPFAQGVGIDIARDRVALAEAAKGNRPINYIASNGLTAAGGDFDLAFSHEVIYLIEDLSAHAKEVATALKPGGVYDAVTCCHSDNPLYADVWRPMIGDYSNIAVPNHSVADIADAFRSAGLELTISRFMAGSFIPGDAPNDYFPTELDRVDVYTKWKLCFRCRKPLTP